MFLKKKILNNQYIKTADLKRLYVSSKKNNNLRMKIIKNFVEISLLVLKYYFFFNLGEIHFEKLCLWYLI